MILNVGYNSDDLETSLKNIFDEVDSFDVRPALMILFISSKLDLEIIETFLNGREIYGEVIACTTSGELSREGIHDNQMVGQVYFEDEFCAKIFSIPNLSNIPTESNVSNFSNVSNYIKEVEKGYFGSAKSFGIVLVDGMSVREEALCSFLSNFLGNVPVIGGSAGDDLGFKETFLLHENKFQSNSALLTIVTTTRKFEVFKSQHFTPSDTKLVITDALPEKRIVNEINGMPAAKYYADVLNIEVNDFSPMIFSRYPLMLKIDEEYFVRSVQKVNDDGSLTFYCAIDNGLVLILANKDNIAESNIRLFNQLKNRLGQVDSCLLFECILRKLEILELSSTEQAEVLTMYDKYNAVGFYTYGEVFSNVHINQTLTGVAFGKR